MKIFSMLLYYGGISSEIYVNDLLSTKYIFSPVIVVGNFILFHPGNFNCMRIVLSQFEKVT